MHPIAWLIPRSWLTSDPVRSIFVSICNTKRLALDPMEMAYSYGQHHMMILSLEIARAPQSLPLDSEDSTGQAWDDATADRTQERPAGYEAGNRGGKIDPRHPEFHRQRRGGTL